MRPFIEIENLEYAYPLEGGGQIAALRGVNLAIEQGEFVALIGPNGSGKSTLARHLNALLLPTSGTVRIDGLLTSDPRHLGAIRQKVGMVFQNPDNQIIATTLEEDVAFGPENLGIPPDEIRQRVEAALAAVDLLDYRLHPPQMLSGGQKQRAAIAGALAARSSCIVFDEPTSMLDPPGRRQVMDTIRHLNATEGLTVLLITHSMSEAMLAQRVLVMAAGQIVLDGPPGQVFSQVEQLRGLGLDVPPMVEIAHRLRGWGMDLPSPILTVEQMVEALGTGVAKPGEMEGYPLNFTRAWPAGQCPAPGRKREDPTPPDLPVRSSMLIQVEDLTHVYAPGTPFERVALRQVNLQIAAGERVGILGPTGSGKSTLAQHLAGLLKPTAGHVLLDGVPVHSAPRNYRLQVGIAFQYPEDQIFEQTVFREVAFGPRNLGLDEAEVAARVQWALEMVGLDPETMSQRMPFTLSGGEMRRVALAGILALRPRVLILDEPTAGQDPQSRRGLLARIRAWQEETGLTLVIISHDLEEGSLLQVVDRLAMLKGGQVVADGPSRHILSDGSLLSDVGLDVPEHIRLLQALRQRGKKVRTDLVSTVEIAAEIAHVWGLNPLPHQKGGP